MKTIHVTVSSEEYETLQQAAQVRNCSIDELVRQAVAMLQSSLTSAPQPRLTELPILPGHRPLAPLPSRSELYDELFGLDRRIGHLASMSPQKNERLTPIKG